ncbi:MAG: helix-hairpin-helix domain-containing protein [Armatimonadota bacterium]
MERIPRGWIALGALILLSCGWVMWRGMSAAPALLTEASSQPPVTPEPPPSAAAPSASSTESAEIVVHVAGAVKKPGVVKIPRGSRVDDAVRAAGGFGSQADPDSINLALLLEDGKQVYVPRKGELVEVEGRVGVVSPAPSSAGKSARQGEQLVGKINLNTATAEQLESLPGIGPVTARAIIEYRKQNGGFRSIEELLEVHGIGEKRLEQIRPFVVVR